MRNFLKCKEQLKSLDPTDRCEITSARIQRQDEDKLLLFSKLLQQRMDIIWQEREGEGRANLGLAPDTDL